MCVGLILFLAEHELSLHEAQLTTNTGYRINVMHSLAFLWKQNNTNIWRQEGVKTGEIISYIGS